MYLIWLLISVFFGLLIETVAYVLIGEKFISWQCFLTVVHQIRKREGQVQYIVMQTLLTGLVLFLLHQKGISLEFYKLIFFTIMMMLIGYIDFKTTFVYRWTTFLTFIGGLFFISVESMLLKAWPIDSVIGFFIGFSVIGLIVFLTRGMGEGDIEIAALCGLFLGGIGSFLTLFLGIIFGGVAGTVLLIRRKKGLKDEMAFGPYLVMGAFIAMLWGNELFQWYLGLF